ncbi:hypothetical protein Salat_2761400 [Sesamum alatum]|uniref:Uncharacterized protein n=1 Tax=Sesamum alatum TaxID=300844 RepID=A0AAE1XLB0_9LAMI|nr:hypothetical protein Salat_2761400 [Sesamum alatum]
MVKNHTAAHISPTHFGPSNIARIFIPNVACYGACVITDRCGGGGVERCGTTKFQVSEKFKKTEKKTLSKRRGFGFHNVAGVIELGTGVNDTKPLSKVGGAVSSPMAGKVELSVKKSNNNCSE